MGEKPNRGKLGALIRSPRLERQWSQGQLATYAKVTRPWLSRVESGGLGKPGRDRLEAVALSLRVRPEKLWEAAGYRTDPLPPDPERDILALIRELENAVFQLASAGPGAPTETRYHEPMPRIDTLRVFEVTGDCLPELEPGDKLVIDTDLRARHGDIVVAERGDERIIKKYYGDEFRSREGTQSTAGWEILGPAVEVRHPLRRRTVVSG